MLRITREKKDNHIFLGEIISAHRMYFDVWNICIYFYLNMYLLTYYSIIIICINYSVVVFSSIRSPFASL